MDADVGLRKAISWPKDKPLKVQEGSGCPACLHTGFHGRTAVFEILIPNDSFKNSLAHSPTQEELNKSAQKSGMLTLRDHAVELLTRGLISGSELERIL